MLRSFFTTEEGQGLVEYALILMLIAIVVIGAMTVLGRQISEQYYGEIISCMDHSMNP